MKRPCSIFVLQIKEHTRQCVVSLLQCVLHGCASRRATRLQFELARSMNCESFAALVGTTLVKFQSQEYLRLLRINTNM